MNYEIGNAVILNSIRIAIPEPYTRLFVSGQLGYFRSPKPFTSKGFSIGITVGKNPGT